MSTTYRVVMSIKQEIDVEVPDEEVAKGALEAFFFACKRGQNILEDEDSHTYIDWTAANKTDQVVNVTAYPKTVSQ